LKKSLSRTFQLAVIYKATRLPECEILLSGVFVVEVDGLKSEVSGTNNLSDASETDNSGKVTA
jgi:hypothetical protein